DVGFHFVDQVAREAKSIAGIEAITANSYTVRSTISPQLQRAVEEALQEGLSRYERSAGNKTGRVLAMTGGFSYPLSQLNRTTQAVRQPGSAIKPLSYLAALGKGLQPNTLISDNPITLPPIAGGRDYWTPKNYDRSSRGTLTLRQALENS